MDGATWGIIGLSMVCLGLILVVLFLARENDVLNKRLLGMSEAMLREITPHAPVTAPKAPPLQSHSVDQEGFVVEQNGERKDPTGKPIRLERLVHTGGE